ncbi:MAG: hypothetical protein SangKO_057640 [Sandaracinaceae bacterium]
MAAQDHNNDHANVVDLYGSERSRARRDSSIRPRVTTVEPGDLSGTKNQNPEGMPLRELVLEDWRTHDSDPSQLGFWALAVHRFGNWRMGVENPKVRAGLSAAYKALYQGVTIATGIDLPYSTKIGRRVRFWHHGGTVISARAVGDDVVFRHNTTVGVARTDAPVNDKPVIGNRVDVGVGAAILGPIEVADDSAIGANAVVVKTNLPGEVLVGIPARPLKKKQQR